MAIEAVEGGVVAVAGVRGVALYALAAVPTRDGGVQTLARAVPADPLLLVHLALQVQRHAVHPQAPHAAQEGPQGAVGRAWVEDERADGCYQRGFKNKLELNQDGR